MTIRQYKIGDLVKYNKKERQRTNNLFSALKNKVGVISGLRTKNDVPLANIKWCDEWLSDTWLHCGDLELVNRS